VKKHNSENNIWIVVDNKVFDVTKFLSEHPGGKKVLVQVAGQDATKKFNLFHKPETLLKYAPKLQIGVIAGTAKPAASASTAVVKSSKPSNPREYGEGVPYGDPNWYQGWHSPYYKPYHYKFREAVRAFVDKEVTPFCHEWSGYTHTYFVNLKRWILLLLHQTRFSNIHISAYSKNIKLTIQTFLFFRTQG
jgi:predicted heme/steroid binding protein